MKVTVFPRLHITLIGMNHGGYRINGGIGFALTEPKLFVSAEPSKSYQISDNRKSPLSKDGFLRLKQSITNAMLSFNLKQNIALKIEGSAGTHFGFGTGTAIRLAALELLLILNKKDLDKEKLIALSGRGKTSGIGVNTYFSGGMVFDLGHKNLDQAHLPSSVREFQPEIPLLLKQTSMPKWEIGICIPRHIQHVSSLRERKFFEETCPIPDQNVYETLYHVTYGIYASVQDNDIETFCKSIISIQNCFWKAAERRLYGKKILEIEDYLYKNGARAVGMSSLGPCLFFISNNIKNIQEKIGKNFPTCDVIATLPSETGRIIEYA